MGHPRSALLSHFIVLLKYNSSPRTNNCSSFSKQMMQQATHIDRHRRLEVEKGFQEIGPRGYFKVLVVLSSKAFRRCFTLGRDEMSSSGGDNVGSKSIDGATTTAGDEGESHHFRDECPWSESPQDELVE